MKTTKFALLGLVGLAASCQPSGKYNVNGRLEGISSDTIIVTSGTFDRSSKPVRDTVALTDGKFEMNIQADEAKMVYIMAKPSNKPNPDGSIPAVSMQAASFILLPGHAVSVSGSLERYTVKGGKFYDEIAKVEQQCAPFDQKITDIGKRMTEIRSQGANENALKERYDSIIACQKEKGAFILNYVKQNPDQDAALYLLRFINPKSEGYEEAFSGLSESVRNGVLATFYKNLSDDLEKAKKIAEAEKKVAEGNEAPDFTLKDMEGKEITLSSLRGKYVILDFWGSWCGWCIKGIPDMKKAYAKHKGKMEILGIDCNDTEEKWKEAVKKHEQPWLNVRNEGEVDLTTLYAVKGFPTKLLISPEGIILKNIAGEDPAFYEYLDETIK